MQLLSVLQVFSAIQTVYLNGLNAIFPKQYGKQHSVCPKINIHDCIKYTKSWNNQYAINMNVYCNVEETLNVVVFK